MTQMDLEEVMLNEISRHRMTLLYDSTYLYTRHPKQSHSWKERVEEKNGNYQGWGWGDGRERGYCSKVIKFQLCKMNF